MERLIFHVDVNSAFLSWEAAKRVANSEADIRLVPSAIGGDREKRTGVILAKSLPAKNFKVKTGEPVAMALKKCPDILLAKPASDFEKPDKIHTLFTSEVETKLWSLPVRDLFTVGQATAERLGQAYIFTIGELAKTELNRVQLLVGVKFGQQIHNYANGIDSSPVLSEMEEVKGYSNSTTLEEDVQTTDEAYRILLALADSVASRMRAEGAKAYCVAVTIRGNDFVNKSHQRKLAESTDITFEIFDIAKKLFSELWDKRTPLRLLGVSLSDLTRSGYTQQSLFSDEKKEREKKLDKTIDSIRNKFGSEKIALGSIFRSGTDVGKKYKAQLDNKEKN